MKAVEVSKRALQQIQRGSLWIFANEFVTKMKDLEGGEWVEFFAQGEFVGAGYVNPQSLIAGRVCSLTKITDRKIFFKERLTQSRARRSEFLSIGCYRLAFSESDGVPGLIIDCYGETVVAQTTTAGMDVAKSDWVQAIQEVLKPDHLVVRADSSIRHLEGVANTVEVIKGDEKALRHAVIHEDDVLLAANFVEGQKTGFFIDQRENRRELRRWVKGKRVLDLCCYSGGWGLTALKADAKHVTFMDQSNEAIQLVKRGLELNSVANERAACVTADVFDFLEKDVSQYDVVILDPPAFVKSKKNLPQALHAYGKLNSLALKRLAPGGVLFSCSCSFHISDGDFEDMLKLALEKQRLMGQVVYRGTQSADHPWILNRPESKYLKCLGVQLS